MDCKCKVWVENIDKLNSGFAALTARNPDSYKGYTGVQFTYCPWCGNKIEKDQD